ncbi:MAG: helix-turn-helix transcriptional regulator [Paludibacterium sp.]|uniref:ArsR/SmtB family transcription factor n=1 Tax=Paludibacterium sp. TaxID=1917523 RepID=UPI0025EB512E|nr:helix-turn-helix transcriptional regulator [Paludibacterium sp.]MBV8049325.1 helix-turn-helix transcriptional regulator [Paludibacterium sp.]MBV8646996.1 helix-turn-helix transcriptional regulator [Paludibacterium sp.]
MDTQNAARLFDCLSAATRLDIYRLLIRMGHEGMVAGDIAAALQVAPNKLSFHLKALAHAGMVSATAEGRFVRYRANLALMLDLVAYLSDECCSGHPEQCAGLRPTSCCPGTDA